MKKKIRCLLLAIIVIFNSVSSGLLICAEETTDTADNVTKSINVVKTENDDNSFLNYLSLHSNSQKTNQAVEKNLDDVVLNKKSVKFSVSVPKEGLYGVGISYKTLDSSYSNILLGLKVDGEYPFDDAKEFTFPRMWCNSGDSNRVDAVGNEYAPQQVEYKEFFYNEPICDVAETHERYFIYLTAGEHNVELIPISGSIEIDYFAFSETESYKRYTKPTNDSLYYGEENIVIEGEDAIVKSSYFLIGKSDTSSVDVTPNSASNSKINYIGGGNWKTIGETLIWETPELEEGYYQIGFSFRQNLTIGGKSYRKLTIDGDVPFDEAKSIGFGYDDNWQSMFFENGDSEPYLLYLSKGKHKIALTVTAGEVAPVRDMLVKASEELGSLYIDITMITGEKVDLYRDYELFKQIGDMEGRLVEIRKLLQESAERLVEITGEASGANHSIIMNMIQVIDQMLNNKYDAHKYKDYYYSNYCSISSVIQTLTDMPLLLDKIILASVGTEKPVEKSGFFEKTIFSVKRFVTTFIKDYSAVSLGDKNSITVWVNWGRDQAQVLSSLIENSFTPKTGITVDLKLANASVVQANLLGDGPDCMLMNGRSTPVDLAMRGVLHDLSQFDDCEDVLKRFQKGAEIPYMYNGKLYALPDTQSFYVMFYRKDILQELNIDIPKTWDEFRLAATILMRNNMNVCMPNNASTVSAQVDIGSASIFPTLLLQNEVPLYEEDGRKTNLLSADAMEVLEMWTNFYRKQKLPISMDFYTRFRVGTTPLGINTYTFYTTLKAAASEIDGLWGVTAIPGTVNEDGTVNYTSAGTGTGCVIMKNCDKPDAAWEFLKWWTEEDTQLSYSNEIEAILGPTGRIAVANVEAFKNLGWDRQDKEELLLAWDSVEEIPEYPGSYYVSRSVYQCFWNVVNSNKSPKDMLMKYGEEANKEMTRKWKQYSSR